MFYSVLVSVAPCCEIGPPCSITRRYFGTLAVAGTMDPDPQRNRIFREGHDITRFFFYYEYVAMVSRSETEKAAHLPSYLDGEAYEFYFDKFVTAEVPSELSHNFAEVKTIFMENFGEVSDPQIDIAKAVDARLDLTDLNKSLRAMERIYEKAGLPTQAKFGVVRKSVMDPDLVNFCIKQKVTDYVGLKSAVREYWSGKKLFGRVPVKETGR